MSTCTFCFFQIVIEDPHAADVEVHVTTPPSPTTLKASTAPITIDPAAPNDGKLPAAPTNSLYPSSFVEAVGGDSQIAPDASSASGPGEAVVEDQTKCGGSQSDTGGDTASGREGRFGPELIHLPKSISDPVPPHWRTIEGHFILVALFMVSHMGHGMVADLGMRMGTERIRVTYIKSDMTRMEMMDMLVGVETGAHLEMDRVHTVDVRACRLEPMTAPGMLTVDGEMVDYESIQLEVHPHLARVMSRRRQKKS